MQLERKVMSKKEINDILETIINEGWKFLLKNGLFLFITLWAAISRVAKEIYDGHNLPFYRMVGLCFMMLSVGVVASIIATNSGYYLVAIICVFISVFSADTVLRYIKENGVEIIEDLWEKMKGTIDKFMPKKK